MFLKGLSLLERAVFAINNVFDSEKSRILIEINKHYFSLGVELPPWVDVPPPDPLFEDELPIEKHTSTSDEDTGNEIDSPHKLEKISLDSYSISIDNNSEVIYSNIHLSNSEPQLSGLSLVVVPASPTFKASSNPNESKLNNDIPLLKVTSDESEIGQKEKYRKLSSFKCKIWPL
ncbi:hypothetical protein AYI69_g529 [Smittium culicis]|uniref:Uncharacterized protein n=1 Tax=Smittium culicis TaxID=133412 RepID=A0A1R1Y5D9_9FUNG|nr:hypothetical protein AYI69_g5498 [Smittium culicis]OMJ29943.1 hypothetical protein AYI69_g529 [Smittium culicis]